MMLLLGKLIIVLQYLAGILDTIYFSNKHLLHCSLAFIEIKNVIVMTKLLQNKILIENHVVQTGNTFKLTLMILY